MGYTPDSELKQKLYTQEVCFQVFGIMSTLASTDILSKSKIKYFRPGAIDTVCSGQMPKRALA